MLLAWAPPAAAEDDEAADTKIFRSILEGLGLRKDDGSGIEYRERSPLVVPPSRALPPPDAGTTAAVNPAWPVDPEIKRSKQAAAADNDLRSPSQIQYENAQPLRPDQLRKGALARSDQKGGASNSEFDGKRRLNPSELGYSGGLFKSLFGGNTDSESATFTSEPARTSLTEPPPGYQTPSPNQPYGINTKNDAKPLDPKDKGLER
jgi:hypothetical protein